MPLTPTRSPLSPMTLVAIAVLLAMVGGLAVAAPGTTRAADPRGSAQPIRTIQPRTPGPSGPTPLGTQVTFHGRGYGHGVGMNQYGARGRALAGQTAEEILAHYYRGTTLGSLALDTPIRVRVLVGFTASSSKPLVIHGRRAGWRIDGVSTVFPKDARLEVRPTVSGGKATWKVKVIAADGAVLRNAGITTFRIRGSSSSTVFEVDSKGSKYDTYRAAMRIGLSAKAPTASVTNELLLERYLRGVVPAEMPSSWPTEALEAQSIAARSYAARRLRPGVSYFDVPDDSSSQVYLGVLGEKPATTATIDATGGVVLKSGSSIANAMFHSAGGGATEHNENVYVSSTGAKVAGPVSYLRGSMDRRPDGTAYDDGSPYATWATRTYTRSQLSAWFGGDPRTNVGSVTALDLRDRGVSGRLISVTLIGSLGKKKVSGDVFRNVFNAARPSGDPSMRSTLADTNPVP
jgi:stage II sporulation protein D